MKVHELPVMYLEMPSARRPLRLRSLAVIAVAMLALVTATSAIGCANKAVTATPKSGTLVAYTEEQGGIVFRHTSLIVSVRGRATMRFEKCTMRFGLNGALWRRLKTALRLTDMHTLAGDYGPATRHAEESSWVIIVGRDTVRITASSIPSELKTRMEPLLKLLDEVISVGKRDLPRSCTTKQTIEGTGRDNQTSHTGG